MKAPIRIQVEREFIAFTALLSTAIALSIDMVLPAFADLRSSFGMEPTSNLPGLTITCIFVGMAIGMPFFGPLADPISLLNNAIAITKNTNILFLLKSF